MMTSRPLSTPLGGDDEAEELFRQFSRSRDERLRDRLGRLLRAHQVGYQGHLSKPADVDELTRSVAKLVLLRSPVV